MCDDGDCRRYDSEHWCITADDIATAAAAAESYKLMPGQPANKSGSGRPTAAVRTTRESGSSQSDVELWASWSATGTGAGEPDPEPQPSQSSDWKPGTDSFHGNAKLWLQHCRTTCWRRPDTSELSGNVEYVVYVNFNPVYFTEMDLVPKDVYYFLH